MKWEACIKHPWCFPDGSNGKESDCNTGDLGSIPGSGRSPGGANGNPLQHSCLENFNRGAWRATVHGVAQSDTTERLKLAFSFSLCCVSNYFFWRKKHLCNGLNCKAEQFFLGTHFYLKEEQTVVKIDISGRHVLKDK